MTTYADINARLALTRSSQRDRELQNRQDRFDRDFQQRQEIIQLKRQLQERTEASQQMIVSTVRQGLEAGKTKEQILEDLLRNKNILDTQTGRKIVGSHFSGASVKKQRTPEQIARDQSTIRSALEKSTNDPSLTVLYENRLGELDKEFAEVQAPYLAEVGTKEKAKYQKMLEDTKGMINSVIPKTTTDYDPKTGDFTQADLEEQERRDRLGLSLLGPHRRPDGTSTGPGWLGTIPDGHGMINTEVIIGVQLEANNGKETDIPAIVPTLNKKEIDYFKTTEEKNLITENPNLWKGIVQKAVNHANKMIRAGKSPFKPGILSEETSEPQTKEKFKIGQKVKKNGKTYTYIGNGQWSY